MTNKILFIFMTFFWCSMNVLIETNAALCDAFILRALNLVKDMMFDDNFHKILWHSVDIVVLVITSSHGAL